MAEGIASADMLKLGMFWEQHQDHCGWKTMIRGKGVGKLPCQGQIIQSLVLWAEVRTV